MVTVYTNRMVRIMHIFHFLKFKFKFSYLTVYPNEGHRRVQKLLTHVRIYNVAGFNMIYAMLLKYNLYRVELSSAAVECMLDGQYQTDTSTRSLRSVKYTWSRRWFGFLRFYGISTFVAYLIPNLVFTNILNIWFVDPFCRYTKLNDQTLLLLTIQFNIIQQS